MKYLLAASVAKLGPIRKKKTNFHTGFLANQKGNVIFFGRDKHFIWDQAHFFVGGPCTTPPPGSPAPPPLLNL